MRHWRTSPSISPKRSPPTRSWFNIVHPHLIRTNRHAARVAWQAKRFGVTETEAEAQIALQNPIRRVLEPDDVTPLVLLLASPLSGGTTGNRSPSTVARCAA